jgi:hypothetical protein
MLKQICRYGGWTKKVLPGNNTVNLMSHKEVTENIYKCRDFI